MTNAQIVSDVINELRRLGVDDRISKRFVLSKLRDANGILLKRENDQLRLPYSSDIWTSVECINMVPATYTECAEISVPTGNYVISEKDFPDIYSYKNGPIIRELTSLDNSRFYIYTTPLEYSKITKREFQDKSRRYFWFKGNKIVIPDGPEKINITAAFKDSSSAKYLNCCQKLGFINPMGEKFPCPQHLLATVKELVTNELMSKYMKSIEDEVPDQDTNNKSQPR